MHQRKTRDWSILHASFTLGLANLKDYRRKCPDTATAEQVGAGAGAEAGAGTGAEDFQDLITG